MSTVTIYVCNFDRFYGIEQFLIIARDYWAEKNNQSKSNQANEYIEQINEQKSLEPGGFELEVPVDISKFAKESSQGVDGRLWEVLDANAEMKGDVEKGYRLLTSI